MIDRRNFVPSGIDVPWPVPLSSGCTVPTEQMAYLLADLIGDAKDVLELGTGSGYQTAVLAERCRSVVSVEINPQPDVAAKLPSNVAIVRANAYDYESGEMFDAVLVTFSTETVEETWADQVKEGGRLIIPLQIGSMCRISVYQRKGRIMQLVEVPAYAPFTEGVAS